MIHPSKTKKLLQYVVLALVAIDFSACTMVEGREKPSEYADDAGISNKLRADILADKQLSVLDIHVETMQGVVQLSGFVDSSQTEARAVQLAESEHGVKLVKDNLVVR